MYNIAVCDDEITTCQLIEKQLLENMVKLGVSLSVDVFYSGEALIDYLRTGKEYDFLILDIELERLNGVAVGNYLRKDTCNFHTQIIYISSKETYAMQLFATQPLDFLVKPIGEEALLKAIKRGLEIMVYSGDFFTCKFGRENITIACKEILYLTSEKRMIRVICRDEYIEYYGKLSNEIRKLPNCFLQIHHSFVINMNAVKRSGIDYVIMNNGDVLKISRKYAEDYKRTLFARWKNMQGDC